MGTVGFIARLRKDFEYRAYIGSTVSFFASLAFMGYNIFLGAVYGTVWNIGVAAYYLLLVAVRAFVGRDKIQKARAVRGEQGGEEKKRFPRAMRSSVFA